MHIWLQNREELHWKKYLMDNAMAKLRITQIKSSIGSDKRQKATLEALGLKKMFHTVEHENRPNILGMINKVRHLVKIEEI
ncbi:MAG: 50S ribosomal protein L30 [Bacteroidales bacterium]|nr:50S ribosomal protein L30 [Bacteroidales bacterium]